VKQRVVEDEAGRRALHARFLFSQKFSQKDPWTERASGAVDGAEFRLVATAAAAE
jgi:nitrite reductase (NADH) large subunit